MSKYAEVDFSDVRQLIAAKCKSLAAIDGDFFHPEMTYNRQVTIINELSELVDRQLDLSKQSEAERNARRA